MMKRLGLIAGMLVMAFGAMWLSSPGGAESDDIPVLQSQVADLQTRVAALESAEGTPAADVTVVASSGTAMLFQGTGHQIVDVGRLEEGVYIVKSVYNGSNTTGYDALFVEMTGKTTGNWELIVNGAAAPVDDSTVLNIYDSLADDYLMEVKAQGDWTITIEPAS